LADRLAVENPLLACRVAALPQVEPRPADPERVGALLAELAAGAILATLADHAGICVLDDASVLGIVLADEPSRHVDLTEFNQLAATNPSWLLPAGTGSLAAAVNLWASAVRAALRPQRRLFPSSVPTDPDAVVAALTKHERACAELLRRTAEQVLPSPAVGPRILDALDQGLIAIVGNPQPGPLSRPDVSVTYRRGGGEILVVREGDPRVDANQLSTYGSADSLLRQHPTRETAKRVLETLLALTAKTWPAP
jgi:hypothetical protein